MALAVINGTAREIHMAGDGGALMRRQFEVELVLLIYVPSPAVILSFPTLAHLRREPISPGVFYSECLALRPTTYD